MRPAGIGAGGDDAEVGTRLREHLAVDVRFAGRFFEVGDALRATRQPLPKEALGALAALKFQAIRRKALQTDKLVQATHDALVHARPC